MVLDAASAHDKTKFPTNIQLLAAARKKHLTPIAISSTSAFQPVAPRSTVMKGIESWAEQSPAQESKIEVGAITPRIAPAVQTYTSPNISARNLIAPEAE